MGAGLRQNIGTKWGPQTWKTMANSSPNKVFSNAANRSSARVEADRKRKATEQVKEKRRRSKYSGHIDNSAVARNAYSRHDRGISPEQVEDDFPCDMLESLKKGFYNTQVMVTEEEAGNIEATTRGQGTCGKWMTERRKRITASNVGSIAKMRKTTKRCNKVKSLLYSSFRGNQATQYGVDNEVKARQQYVADLLVENHSLEVRECGYLFLNLPHG